MVKETSSKKLHDRYVEATAELAAAVSKGEAGHGGMADVAEAYQHYMSTWKSFNAVRYKARHNILYTRAE